VTSQWFFPGTPVSSTNKTDHHNITEILLNVMLNTITLALKIGKPIVNSQWGPILFVSFLPLFSEYI